MRYRLNHQTVFSYGAAATSSRSLAHLRPRETTRQRVIEHSFDIAPGSSAVASQIDYFGNLQHLIEISEPHASLTIASRAEVDVDPLPPLMRMMSPPWESARGAAPPVDEAGLDAAQFALESPHVPVGAAYAAIASPFFAPAAPILESALGFNAHLHRLLSYQPGSTSISTPIDAVIAGRRGVCQDFAHVALACLRSLGLSARYVSGYLHTGNGERDADGGGRMIGADASHAWISLRCGELGWIDLDPTNDCLAGQSHITVAYGRDFSDVTPVKGVLVGGGSGQEVSVAVTVERV